MEVRNNKYQTIIQKYHIAQAFASPSVWLGVGDKYKYREVHLAFFLFRSLAFCKNRIISKETVNIMITRTEMAWNQSYKRSFSFDFGKTRRNLFLLFIDQLLGLFQTKTEQCNLLNHHKRTHDPLTSLWWYAAVPGSKCLWNLRQTPTKWRKNLSDSTLCSFSACNWSIWAPVRTSAYNLGDFLPPLQGTVSLGRRTLPFSIWMVRDELPLTLLWLGQLLIHTLNQYMTTITQLGVQ